MKCKTAECRKEAAPRTTGRPPVYCSPECARSNNVPTPEARRQHKLMHKYGISVAEYDQLLADQDGRCAICGVAGPEAARWGVLVVDHDHESGKVRGLLCSNCNCAIGLLGDSPERLNKAAAYLLAKLPLKEGIRG